MDRLAAAKINLSLTVRGRQPDGYHQLESLVAFADIGDRLQLTRATQTQLTMRGPFADTLAAASSGGSPMPNLVLQAHAALQQASGQNLPTAMTLEKNLPVAAGLGGGSADAAACLRGLATLYELDMAPADLHRLAAGLGADVPVCLHGQAVWMRGIGDDLQPLASALPAADIVLVNPRLGLATGEVFAAAGFSQELRAPQSLPDGFDGLPALCDFLRAQGNDLQDAAIALQPEIAACLSALNNTNCLYAAMSGSGASCFALAQPGEGPDIAAAYAVQRPDDWVQSGALC